MIIRRAEPGDASRIAAIWNTYIRETTITFTTDEKSSADVVAYIAERRDAGKTVVVAQAAGRVTGFAASSAFRSGPGYALCCETSVMLDDSAIGAGIGRALMAEVEATARAAGLTAMVAGISGENDAAIAFHTRLGFDQVGYMPGVGQKFGRALDLVLMQKRL